MEKDLSIDERLANVEQQIREIEEKFPSKVKPLVDKAVQKFFPDLEKGAESLHKRIQFQWSQILTVTELCYVVRGEKNDSSVYELHKACIWALEQDASFWAQFKDLTLNKIRPKLLAAYQDRVIG